MRGQAGPKDKPNKSAVQMAKAVKVAQIAAMMPGGHVPNAATKAKIAQVPKGVPAKTVGKKVARSAHHVSHVPKDNPKMSSATNPKPVVVAATVGIAVVDPKGKLALAQKGRRKGKDATKTAGTKMAGTISVAVASHVVKALLQKTKAHPTTLLLDATPPFDRICVQPLRYVGLQQAAIFRYLGI